MAIDPSRQTVSAALGRVASLCGDREGLVDGEVRLTFAALREAVHVAARSLVDMGVRPGDRVALCAPNSAHWVVAALGALHAGASLVPINTRFTAAETLDVLVRSNARAFLVEGSFLGRDRLAELAGEPLPELVLRLPFEWPDADAELPAVSSEDVCDIMYTSGTTGRSKGAMSAHRQSLGVAEAWAACGELSTADRYLIVNPFFHTFGYKAGILACLLTGATIVPQPVFDVVETMRLIERERITVLPGAPTIFQSLLDHPERGSFDLSSLRLAVTGAAVVPVALIERMQSELSFSGVLTAYGLTEAVVATMCRLSDSPTTVATTCGAPMAGFELRLGEQDEVLLRGPNVMLGYLDDPEATAAAIDSDGWLHTGDVGRVDERGYLSITDRLKDMYICGGFNVYPAEVEQALARLPGVAESAVVGMADARLGEVGKAFVVTSPGHQLTEAAVIGFCRERLANYKVPRAVEFLPALPRNAGGKVLKNLLRKENS